MTTEDTTDPIAAADAAGADFRRRETAIRADATLSADERGRRLAELERERAQLLIDVKRDDATATAAARTTAWQEAFGATGDPAARRDADRYAATITSPHDALDALRHADRLGDEAAARAIAARALEAVQANPFPNATGDPWRAVLDAYAELRPHTAAPIAQLLPDVHARRSRFARRIGLESRLGR